MGLPPAALKGQPDMHVNLPAAGRSTLRATMTAAMQEVDRLAYERHATPFGK